MAIIRYLLCVGFVLVLGLPSMATIIWPADNAWNPVYKGSDYYNDPAGDVPPGNPQLDLIGTSNTYSAASWAIVQDGWDVGPQDALMMRMRVGADGSSSPNAWMALLDTDGNTNDVEWALQLVMSGGNDDVRLVEATTGGPTIGEVVLSGTPAWSGDIAEFSRWTAIPSTTQYHADFAIPWNSFEGVTGLTDLSDVRVILATSTTHTGFNNGDAPLGAGFSEQVSNLLSEDIPEPAAATLIIGMGSGMLFFRRRFSRDPA